ncbi:MAG: MFS transporter [Candidatus Hermodarchaeota archaeon]
MNDKIQIYNYRWIVLLLFMFANITIQILWISFAAVTSYAMAFYVVEELRIYLLSLVFMIVYIPVTFIATWLIDKYDFKIGAGVGAILAGVFGLLRFFAGTNYMLVLIFQIGVAIGQPFLLNTMTKMSANWFPDSERTTATGLGMISVFIGIGLGLFVTPFIVEGISFEAMLLIYGLLALSTGLLFVVFGKNRPPTPPSLEITSEKVFVFEGLKKLFTNVNFLILVVVFFIGLGIFNTITTYIEGICLPRNFDSTFAGILGGLMLIGGIIGALVMSTLSDKYQKRKILMIVSILMATISLFIISFAVDAILLLIFGFLFGFGVVSASPVALEYAVKATHPVPEASSNGMLMMVGQIGGILLILGLEDLKLPSEDYFPALILQTILLAIALVLVFFLKEKN